jgi:hypothetical protein
LLKNCGMTRIRDGFNTMTINDIIQRMSGIMGLNAWKFNNMTAEATMNILACLRQVAAGRGIN